MTHLILGDARIADLTPLGGLGSLTHLWLRGNSISDVAPLASLTSLTWVNLRFNQIGGSAVDHVPAARVRGWDNRRVGRRGRQVVAAGAFRPADRGDEPAVQPDRTPDEPVRCPLAVSGVIAGPVVNDNALAEGKNAHVVCKWCGREHFPQRCANDLNRFAPDDARLQL